MMPTIRKATEQDYGVLCDLFREENQHNSALAPDDIVICDDVLRWDEFTDMLLSDDYCLLVAVKDNDVVGACLSRKDCQPQYRWAKARVQITIEDIVVSNRMRRQGIGELLVAGVKDWAKGQGIEQIRLHVWAANQSALKAYQSYGFEVTQCMLSWREVD